MAHDAAATRRRILEAADTLFYDRGVQAVGVDLIAEAAGVTKRTLYYHFRSKDDLIAAYLAERDEPTLERYRGWLAGAGEPLGDRVERMFQRLAASAADPKWRGCGFLRTAVELADLPGHPARHVASAHKKRFEAWLAQELREAGTPDAASRARSLMVVLDGAILQLIVHKDAGYAATAAALARTIVEPPPPSIGRAQAPSRHRVASA